MHGRAMWARLTLFPLALAAIVACGGSNSAPALGGGAASGATTSFTGGNGGTTLMLVQSASSTPAPLLFITQTRFQIPGSATLHVAIVPAPVLPPSIAWSSSDAGIAALAGATAPPALGGMMAPPSPPDALFVQGARLGAATVSARVGAPYDTTLTQSVYAYARLAVGCGIGDAAAVSFNDDGTLGAGTPDIVAGVPSASATPAPCGSGAGSMLQFPFGAVAVPIASAGDFVALRASAWRSTVFDSRLTPVPSPPATLAWLFKTHDGAIVKYGFGGFEVAAPGAEFPTTLIAAAPSATLAQTFGAAASAFTASIAQSSGSLFTPFGPSSTIVVGAPVGFGLIDQLLSAQAHVSFSPSPYASPPITWTGTGVVAGSATGTAAYAVAAPTPGTGTLTVSAGAPVNASASIAVAGYPVVAVGCGDLTYGAGVAFVDERTITYTADPARADLFASYDPSRATCGPAANATPPPPGAATTPESAGWYFPGGGVFFPNGDDPSRQPPAGSPRGTTFDRVSSAQWSAARTSETYTPYRADIDPCIATVNGIGEPLAGCTTMPDRILLIRSRTGRLVKLFWLGRAPGSFVGLYAVSSAAGTFAY